MAKKNDLSETITALMNKMLAMFDIGKGHTVDQTTLL